MLDDGDEGARVGLWVAVGVVALLLFGLLGGFAKPGRYMVLAWLTYQVAG